MKRSVLQLVVALLLCCAVARGLAQQAPDQAAVPETSAPPARVHVGDFVRVFADGELPASQQCNSAVFVFSSGKIDGVVKQKAVCVFGSLEVNGTVERDLVVVFGGLKLGSNAVVKGEIAVIGGELERVPGAKLSREPYEVGRFGDYPVLAGIGNWLRHGLLLGRPLPPGVPWVWWVAGAFLLIYAMTLALFPRPVEACVQTLEQRPVGSFFTGLLVKLLLAPVLALLLASGVGVLVIPFLLLALVAVSVLGKTAVLRFTGQQLGKQLGAAVAQRPMVALLAGAVVFCLLYMIPVLGFIAWGGALLMALGAATLAAISGLRRETGGHSGARSGNEPPPVRLRAAGEAPAGDPPPALSSAEEVALPRAGFWMRFLALALDVFLFLCVVFLLSAMSGGRPPRVVPAFLLLLWGAYHIGMWTWKGTTVGGIVMGLKLVRIDGRPVDVAVAIVRALSSLFSAMALGLGFFWAGWSRDKCSWHDRIAGTVIVKAPRGMVLV